MLNEEELWSQVSENECVVVEVYEEQRMLWRSMHVLRVQSIKKSALSSERPDTI